MKKCFLVVLPLLLFLGGCGDIEWFPSAATPATPATPKAPPTAVTEDDSKTVALLDPLDPPYFEEDTVTSTSVKLGLLINLKNNSTTTNYNVKVDYVVFDYVDVDNNGEDDTVGYVAYSGSVQGPVAKQGDLPDQLYERLEIDPATYAKFDELIIVAITITPAS